METPGDEGRVQWGSRRPPPAGTLSWVINWTFG